MKKTLLITIILAALTGSQSAIADEGMWMINAIDAALEKKMQERGLELSAREIYNADAPGASVSDAVVSMEFGCTGSMISDQGLLITNHHCAYGDVHALSTPEHNYLDEGFWAMRSEEEVNIKGKSVYFLKKVIDVTEEVEALKIEQRRIGKGDGIRRLSYLMEQKYSKETGLEALLSSMWSGSKYYLALYVVYRDVRLVAAPPVSSAAFGGDIDNWEWPQHKCDFALYRIYTAPDGSPAEYSEENIPMKPAAKLKISLDGYKAGDYAMIIGYPGSTDRYSSSFKAGFNNTHKHPASNRLRGEQMKIISRWMDADPEIRLKYSDYYFSLSNVQELFSGQVECINRFDVIDSKREIEKELQEWIGASPERTDRWGDLLERLDKVYKDVEKLENDVNYFRETIIRGTRIVRACHRVNNIRSEVLNANGIKPKKPMELTDGPDPAEEECCRCHRFCGKKFRKIVKSLMNEYEKIDLRVEKDLFAFAVREFYANVDRSFWGDYHMELADAYKTAEGKADAEKIAETIWENSFMTDLGRLETFLEEEHTVADYFDDPFFRFMQNMKVVVFNEEIQKIEGENRRLNLNREYTHALYQMRLDKGIVQYPDANSTMRLTYGTVGGIEPRDGMVCDWKTTPAGILEKHDPSDYEFRLDDRQYLLYRSGDWGRWGSGPDGKDMYVNFMTDNDITGGNSGSPVLNSRGELIGLAFDGNKESLASDVWYTPDYNKCVCVDIRFILWTIDRYAGMTRIIEELGL